MQDLRYLLPEYPQKSDIWERLKAEKRKIAVYGMGNGADKLFERLAQYGIKPDAVFASDGFVRGHSFRGYEVISLCEVENRFGDDFIILVSFASNRAEVIELIKSVAKKHETYIPDMPVAGEEYFDKDFYNSNYGKILSAFDSLADDYSRELFASVVKYKLSANPDDLFKICSDKNALYSLLPRDITIAYDIGAYNGDTARELISSRSSVERIYAVEPDKRNFKKLVKYISESGEENRIIPINAAAWSGAGGGEFIGSGNRNSSVCSTASYQNKKEQTELISVDSISDDKVDYIKYDVEGAEMEALTGSHSVINKYRPSLLVSAYHRSEDVFLLVNYLKERYPFYRIFMHRIECFPAWELSIIALPIENGGDMC